MAATVLLPDAYTWKARIMPAMLVALPAALVVFAYMPSGAGVIYSLLTEAGVAFLCGSFTRRAGKSKEKSLFSRWGGRPSEQMLSHRHCKNAVILARRHHKLRVLLPSLRVPTAAEEQADGVGATKVYEACTDFLRGRTRDKAAFPLVFEENCNYGFARNLWGSKKAGLFVAGGALVTLGGALLIRVAAHERISAMSVLLLGLVFAQLLTWVVLITPDWVRVAADSYSERLLEALDTLD